jgi:tetratricopeptide (TPR) repeat protein
VAEAVIAATSPEGLRADHGRIATALEGMPHVRPERRALHWAWAGEPARAAAAALELVASARHALAYSRAADVCALVLQLEVPAEVRGALERAHADALAGAGEALRAAVAYRAAAAGAVGTARLDLERRAAENFLRCAAIDDGMALFDRVAGALGYRRGGSPAATIAALLVERARLRVRGTGFRRGAVVDAALAARSDACYSLSTGLAMLDAISGALFQTRSTRLALDCGDPARAARALAIEACFVAAWGSRTRERAGRILEAAGVLASEVEGPMVRALVDTGRGICALQWGDFDDAVRYCDEAIAIFREHGAGVVWEERTGEVFATWALAWRGDWGEVGRRCDALARAGAATGDRYASMHAAVGPAVCGLLAADEPGLARERVVEAMEGWRRDRMDLPQVRELVALSMIGLHEGAGVAVLETLRARWRDLERSRMLDLEPVLGTLSELRARAALMAGDLADARTWTKRLARVPWAAGIAKLFRASLLAAAGSRDAALAELERAEIECHARRVELYAAAARERRGLIVGDAELVESAHAAAREREIVNPERVLRSLAPWPG